MLASAPWSAAWAGGVEQPGLIAAGVGSDGLTGGDQGVHHGLVPHLGAGHVAEGLQRFGEDGLDARRIDLIPLGGLLLETIQPGVPQGDGTAAVQDHDSHGRIVQHGLDAAL